MAASAHDPEVINNYMGVIRQGIMEIIARQDREIDAKLSTKNPVEILMEAIDSGEPPIETRTVEAFRFDRCYLRKDRAALMDLYHCLAGTLKIAPSDIQTWIANGEEVVQDRVQAVFRMALGDRYPITPAEHLKKAIDADKIPTDPQTVTDFCFDRCESDEVADGLLDFYRCLNTFLKAPLTAVGKLIAVKQFGPFVRAKFVYAIQWAVACGFPDEEQAEWITDTFDWFMQNRSDIFEDCDEPLDPEYADVYEEAGVKINTAPQVQDVEASGCGLFDHRTGHRFVVHPPSYKNPDSEPGSTQPVPAAASVDEDSVAKYSSALDEDGVGALLAAYDWFCGHCYIFGPLNTARDKKAVMAGVEDLPPDSGLSRSRRQTRDTRVKMAKDINDHAANGVHLAYLLITPHVNQKALLIYPGKCENDGDDPDRIKVVRLNPDESETVVLVTDSYDEAVALATKARADFVRREQKARRAAASSTEETATTLSSMTLEESRDKGEVASVADSAATGSKNDDK